MTTEINLNSDGARELTDLMLEAIGPILQGRNASDVISASCVFASVIIARSTKECRPYEDEIVGTPLILDVAAEAAKSICAALVQSLKAVKAELN